MASFQVQTVSFMEGNPPKFDERNPKHDGAKRKKGDSGNAAMASFLLGSIRQISGGVTRS